jgi:serine protease inhibitor
MFTSKIYINGQWYYRTESDKVSGNDKGFISTHASNISFESFSAPRLLQIRRPTLKINPISNDTVGPQLAAGTQLMFTSKIYINGQWYYRTESDTNSNLVLAVASKDTEKVPIPYESFDEPRWMRLNRKAYKYVARSEQKLSGISYSAGKDIYFTSKIYINGQWYYRTESDKTLGRDRAFRANNVSSINFTPFHSPRILRLNNGVPKLSSLDLLSSGPTISNGTQLMFTSKIYINGQWYYRTESDTNSNIKRVFPSFLLSETP